MPLYEYQCEACGCCFEKLVFPSDKETPECPGCSGNRVKRIMSRAFCCRSTGGSDGGTGGRGAGFS
jgi:putative FmdB family regulatory protein